MRYAIFVLFVLTQFADGVLTAVGVSRGTVEGNFAIRYLMESWGVLPAITFAKVVSLVFGVLLYAIEAHKTLVVLSILVVVTAIVPWTLHLLGVW